MRLPTESHRTVERLYSSREGLGQTQRNISRCETFFRLLPETPELFQEWKRLVSVHQVSGLKVHDARLVAAMNVYRIPSVITFDIDDFKRYPGIRFSIREVFFNRSELLPTRVAA